MNWRFCCLTFRSAGITDKCHHAWLILECLISYLFFSSFLASLFLSVVHVHLLIHIFLNKFSYLLSTEVFSSKLHYCLRVHETQILSQFAVIPQSWFPFLKRQKCQSWSHRVIMKFTWNSKCKMLTHTNQSCAIH